VRLPVSDVYVGIAAEHDFEFFSIELSSFVLAFQHIEGHNGIEALEKCKQWLCNAIHHAEFETSYYKIHLNTDALVADKCLRRF
jgi:hypothetical protein